MPQRTCTGCRKIVPQRELVRVAVSGPRVLADPSRRLPGRGAYVHPRAACVTIAGLSRGLRRSVSPADVQRIVASFDVPAELSRADDNSETSTTSPEEDAEHPRGFLSGCDGDLNYGLAGAITVETLSPIPPIRGIRAKDDRSEDARV